MSIAHAHVLFNKHRCIQEQSPLELALRNSQARQETNINLLLNGDVVAKSVLGGVASITAITGLMTGAVVVYDTINESNYLLGLANKAKEHPILTAAPIAAAAIVYLALRTHYVFSKIRDGAKYLIRLYNHTSLD